jgi:hypothetical protein
MLRAGAVVQRVRPGLEHLHVVGDSQESGPLSSKGRATEATEAGDSNGACGWEQPTGS